ncbi:hypothetical protein [Edaphobacter dinghuensis]|uniref:Uncharacterized protein n=1 Tax=Edaphobacter dinghuensis TaxID=1560005 RepID=A0A917M931_9BACT|nr:hypothetical protein [Edaphobacter dinghuensis]GGG87039.1 hypothetical protein GCM10011585_33810 [Edaphobacter dinghuensis]
MLRNPHVYCDLSGNGYCLQCGLSEEHAESDHIRATTVAELQADLVFLCDSAEVQDLREKLALSPDEDFDSFFVAIKDGDYTEVWGMPGIVPNKDRKVYPISLARR